MYKTGESPLFLFLITGKYKHPNISKIANMTIKKSKTKYTVQIVVSVVALLVLVLPASASQINPDIVLKYINEAREKKGLSDLETSSTLNQVAQDKLNDMTQNHYFAHTSPAGVTPWDWFSKNGYDYEYAGENLAISFLVAEDQQKAWMDSPLHRKNILSEKFNQIGVAVGAGEVEGKTSIITVTEFGSLAVGAITPADKKTFSADDKESFGYEGGKNSPQVLYAQEKNLGVGEKSIQQVPAKSFDGVKNLLWSETILSVALFIFLLSAALAPLAFLSLAFSEIWAIQELGQGDLEEKPEMV